VDDIQAIRLAKTELREAYRTGNVKRALAVISDSYSEMPAGLASFWGEEAKAVLQHRLKETFTRFRAELAVTIISISIMGNMAFDWGWHKLKLTAKKGGKTVTKKTRYLELWQKEADGQWRIVIFMDNADLKSQMPAASVLRAMRTPNRRNKT
jgi:ketosteroid isomerase-like protein